MLSPLAAQAVSLFSRDCNNSRSSVLHAIKRLPDDQLEALGEICAQKKVSRAAFIRQAVAGYIQQSKADKSENAFGLWKKKNINALKHEDKIRAEWDNR